jgi:hypothetical protein
MFTNVKAYSSEKNQLRIAEQRIKQLENRIEELEQRLPKKYEAVKFLNYQNRKRILVNHAIVHGQHFFLTVTMTFSRLLAELASLDLIWSID